MKSSYGALVVGAGVAGIHAALDLAETGHKVALIDKRPHIGGFLTKLDHQFPSDHCGMCKMLPLTERDGSSQFCLRKGLFHRNIDLFLATELVTLDGDPGQFQATLRKRSTFVDPHKCTGCGKCADVCPVRVPSEFNAGLTERAAIHLPVPQHIPNHYVVDLDNCLRCLECVDACPSDAIDFKLGMRKDFPVLLVDPDKEISEQLTQWLTAHEFPVLHARSAAEAVEQLEKGPVGLALVSTELMEGAVKRVIGRALELRPDLPVFLLQGDGQELSQEELNGFFELGAQRELLRKPLRKQDTAPWLEKQFMRIVTDERIECEVGAVILAAGFDSFDIANDPMGMAGLFLYGQHPGVLTSVEFERLISGTGPEGGGRGKPLLRPGDQQPVRRIAWLQCVGSRDVRRNADFCSSFCCMVSIKEALLAKKRARQAGFDGLETTIFSMDMRTFGKDFQRYRDNAEQEEGVRFVRARIHSVLPGMDADNGLQLQYADSNGVLVNEHFDMVVLAVGARPPKETEQLAQVCGIELNDYGFCATKNFGPSRTSQLGIMAAGAFAGPRDIAESLIVAGAAALEASRLINIYAPLKEQLPEPEPAYRNVTREIPKLLAAVCTSCPSLEKDVDFELLSDRLSRQKGICAVATVGQACSPQGWERIEELVREHRPNRVLVGACMPYAYVPKLRELGANIGLNPALMNVVDIFTPLFETASAPEHTPQQLAREIASLMTMSAVKLMGQDPTPLPQPQPVHREALVVGGGLAGMTAALGIADHGYGVCLVEQEEELGGLAMNLHYTLQGDDPRHYMEGLVEQVRKHPHIRVFTDARVTLSTGRAGRFMSLISTDEGTYPLEHGATVVATGGQQARVYDYGFRTHKSVLSQLELEESLGTGKLDLAGLSGLVMIQCWRSRDENRNYCSRVCCAQALKNIRVLKQRRPDLPVYVLYRDIMSYGFSEHYYTEARKLGAIFIRYDLANKPNVTFAEGKPVIRIWDELLQNTIELTPDLLVLSVGIDANDNSELSEILNVPLTQDGFFQEAESKWRPVDFLKHGVFMCGLAHAPGNMNETIASAKAAAQRALQILSKKGLGSSNTVAEVKHTLCSRCGRCVEVCPYGARRMDMVKDMVVVDELLCQGCGACAAICPNSASYLRGFTDNQVMSVIDAALEELV